MVYDSIKGRFKTEKEDNLGSDWFNKCFYNYSEALIHIVNIKNYLKDKKKVVC